MKKSLDRKLAAIHADPSGCQEFILADAKDADMAFGVGAPGRSPEMHAGEVRFRTLADYREQIRQIVRQGLVDIMLMSASTNDLLTIRERLFDTSHVTPAARANDASDIHVVRGGMYAQEPSRPFRTATIDQIQCGRVECSLAERVAGANLGLYSVTFNNRLDEDLASLEEYRRFRVEAEKKGFRHFWEVFDPNSPEGLSPEQIPQFVSDCIVRALAGVPAAGRPLFLKIVYHGPKAMEELVSYDPQLVVGILGGSAGTTYDAFKLLSEAQKYGARVALFGRKINSAECQLAFVAFLRRIVDGEVKPEEAVRAYHGVLQKLGIKPHRSLDDDMQFQTGVMSYSRSSVAVPAKISRASSPTLTGQGHGGVAARAGAAGAGQGGGHSSSPPLTKGGHGGVAAGGDHASCGCGGTEPSQCTCESKSPAPPTGLPDFSKMTPAEKLAYNKAKRDKIFGG
ncbi:MAG: hypothetical protein HYS13_08550 [Planctomycetia bacterium]|nr:hypothetical protein [Planctomycetia bacterium]